MRIAMVCLNNLKRLERLLGARLVFTRGVEGFLRWFKKIVKKT